MNTALKILRAEEHVSVSSLGTYIRCPRQYEHQIYTPTRTQSDKRDFTEMATGY